LEICNCGSWDAIIWYGRWSVCGQGILGCKCGIVNWKYVTVGVGMLQFDMADEVCVVSGYWDVNVELLMGNM
jgi:hypothetical protein